MKKYDNILIMLRITPSPFSPMGLPEDPSPLARFTPSPSPDRITQLFQEISPTLPEGSFPSTPAMSEVIRAESPMTSVRGDTRKWKILSQTDLENGSITYTSRLTPLGAGSFSKVFKALAVIFSEDEATGTYLAMSQTKRRYYNKAAFALLEKVPPCPQLLGRPLYTDATSSSSSVYTTMELLEEPTDLYKLIQSIEDTQLRFNTFIRGVRNTAIGASVLHNQDIVHRDIKWENMHPNGLFDYDTLIEEGFHTFKGAPIKMCPPELVIYREISLYDDKKCIPEELADYIDQLLGWYGVAPFIAFRGTLPSLTYDDKKEPLYPYTKAVDVFLLGMQFVRYFRNKHPLTWDFCNHSHPYTALKLHVERMLSLNPNDRPSMEECAAFFTALEKNLSESLDERQKEYLRSQTPVTESPV